MVMKEVGQMLLERGCVKQSYIGDGVYVGWDGIQVWLMTPRENGWHEIALEDEVFDRLVEYVRHVRSAPSGAAQQETE